MMEDRDTMNRSILSLKKLVRSEEELASLFHIIMINSARVLRTPAMIVVSPWNLIVKTFPKMNISRVQSNKLGT